MSMWSADTISFFQFSVHLRLVDGTGEQRALRKRRFRPFDVFGRFSGCKAGVIFPVKAQEAALHAGQRPARQSQVLWW